MNVVLDTHVWVWWLTAGSPLKQGEHEALDLAAGCYCERSTGAYQAYRLLHTTLNPLETHPMQGSSSTRDFAQLKELIESIKIGMLTTADDDGTLRSRPLQTVSVGDDHTLWFFTSASSPKVAETKADAGRVNVSYANLPKYDFVSVSGTATLSRDREKMKALWTHWIEAFFPKGLDDPDLALLRVDIEKAEYWDAPGTAIGRLYGFTKALATGNTDGLGENRKLTL